MAVAVKCSKELYEFLETVNRVNGNIANIPSNLKDEFSKLSEEARDTYDPYCKFDAVLPRDHMLSREGEYLVLFD